MVEAASLSVAILCGGAARRMGREKGTVMLDGVSMLDNAIARVRPIASTLILAAGPISDVRREGCITVMDRTPGCGPLGGIVAALEASPHDLCAMVAVDMPDVDAGLLRLLAQRCGAHDAALPVSARGVEPLHGVYAQSALPVLRGALERGDDRSVQSAVRRLRTCYVDAAAAGAEPGFARNLNTPADVTAWLAGRRAAAPPPH